MTNENYLALKTEFIRRITEDGTCKDVERQRKNLRKIRDEIEERAERRQAGLRDFDVHADEQTAQRVLGKIQLEKQALDDAVDELIVEGKLSLEREAFTKLSHTTGLSRKVTERVQFATTGLVKFLVSQFVGLCACIYIVPIFLALCYVIIGTTSLLVQGVFRDSSAFGDALSYAAREIPNSLPLLLWPFSEEGRENHFPSSVGWGLLMYFCGFLPLSSKWENKRNKAREFGWRKDTN